MALMVNAGRLTVFRALYPVLLGSADVTVAPGMEFTAAQICLAALQFCRFMLGQGTVLDAVRDALLLMHVALDVGLHALARYGIRVAHCQIMLFCINVATGIILHAGNLALFGGAQVAVLQGMGLRTVDVSLAAF